MELKIVRDLEDLIKVFIVRGIVFIEEQEVPYNIERDEYDLNSIHILGEEDCEPIAAGRVHFLDGYAKLERIAVRKKSRGKGYGHRIVDFLVSIANEHGFYKYKMHAQAYLKEYYEKHGFVVKGDSFLEANIEHYLMVKEDVA